MDLSDIAIDLTTDAKDFIVKVLEKKPEDRLGFKNGIKDLLEHPWFKGIDVNELK
jgi:serum/glucocorticoid-regulated kinase 2